MVLTGKYEDIAPIIHDQMMKYGGSPSSIPGFKGKPAGTPQSSVPVPSSETRKVAYTETKVSLPVKDFHNYLSSVGMRLTNHYPSLY